MSFKNSKPNIICWLFVRKPSSEISWFFPVKNMNLYCNVLWRKSSRFLGPNAGSNLYKQTAKNRCKRIRVCDLYSTKKMNKITKKLKSPAMISSPSGCALQFFVCLFKIPPDHLFALLLSQKFSLVEVTGVVHNTWNRNRYSSACMKLSPAIIFDSWSTVLSLY